MMKRFYPASILFFTSVFLFAQGFGFDDEYSENASSFNFTFGGEISAGPAFFLNDFKDGVTKESFSLGDLVKANTNFDISVKNTQSYIAFNLSYGAFKDFVEGSLKSYPPAILDKLWLRGFFGNFTVQAGFIKMRWGKMYSPGPLDVINPLDYTDLTSLTETMKMKIASPMIHASYNIGYFSKIEAVFMPYFGGHKIDMEGRWKPQQYSTDIYFDGVKDRFREKINPLYASSVLSLMNNVNLPEDSIILPDTRSIDNFQTGLRFNTTVGMSDIGFQYFYGHFLRPSVTIDGVDELINKINNTPVYLLPSFLMSVSDFSSLFSPNIEYNRYHQIGMDYSRVLYGFNLKGELAFHITEDYRGDNGNVKNPFLAWSLGFDRDVFAKINVNFQCNESIRLFNSKVEKNPAIDCEGGESVSSTRLILQISRNFFREKMECKLVNIWDIEDVGVVFIPSAAWVINDFRLELSAGIFAGDRNSELGQYRDNAFVKLKMKYLF